MGSLSAQGASHRRLARFVDWIRPEDETVEEIRKQAEDIRTRIRAKAMEDGLTVRSTPESGSFAKRTGLRRHMRGDAEIDGQDVDLPFVVSPRTKEGEALDELLSKFEGYAAAIFPRTARSPTKSSISLDFSTAKRSYDIVPMLAVPDDDEAQILLRRDGERRRTSVQKHVEFVRARTRRSNDMPGRVKFNECVRLMKWWREVRQAESQIIQDVPTIVIELLCAKAFDERGVEDTYTETMGRWFTLLASYVRSRKPIGFTDYTKDPLAHAGGAAWAIIDPVNPENNVAPTRWSNLHLSELAEWFGDARDRWARVMARELERKDDEAWAELVVLFGNAMKHHGLV